MIFIIIILIIVIAFCIPINTEEVRNNEIEQVNIIQERVQDDNTEYTYVPVTNGKTVQMIKIPKEED